MGPLILAVDDQAGMRALLKLQLPEQGFRVVVAADSHQAIAVAQDELPDLVLLDSLHAGDDLLERLQARRPQMPVIMLTGWTDHDSRSHALAPRGIGLRDEAVLGR